MPERSKRQSRIDAGLCVTCGTKRPASGRLSCEACLAAGRLLARKRKDRLQSAHKCIKCGAKAVKQRQYCRTCLQYYADRDTIRREKE